MKTFIVTVHTPAPGEIGLVTVVTPSGLIEDRRIAPERVDAFGDSHYVVDLIARMYPGKANKILGDQLLLRTPELGGYPMVEVYAVDTDD